MRENEIITSKICDDTILENTKFGGKELIWRY